MNHVPAARSDSKYVNYVADILFSDENSVTCSWKKTHLSRLRSPAKKQIHGYSLHYSFNSIS